jgi:hypothetical protein
MSSPFQGAEIPGMGSVNDPLGFVKKLWGDMQVPGMVTPTVSVDELDKKIKDLKTVESWLNVNMNMLRGTIQAMEVQRATIATLKSMTESFSQQMGNPATFSGFAKPAAEASATNQWPMPGAAPEEAKAKQAAEEVKPEPKAAASESAAPAAADANKQFSNPAAWWGVLQDQFKQAVSNVMEAEQMAIKAGNASNDKSASKPKPAAASAAPGAKAASKPKPKPKAKPTAMKTAPAAPKATRKRTSPL